MKIKWLYKVALPAVASAMVAPVVVSCSVEKPKPETQEEKEKRLEHQRAMEIAPNLTKFLKDYFDAEKYWREGRDTSEMKVIENIKQLKELTSNINHLNDFEKSYLGLYEDIQNFFNNSIHKYTKDNISFDYWNDPNDEKETEPFFAKMKLEENTITQEQMFYHKMYQIMNDKEYRSNNIERNENTIKHFKEALTPLINKKITEFSKKHKDFQFKNPAIKFKYGKNKEAIIEVSLEVEYQNQKLPKEIIVPLTFNLSLVQTGRIQTEKEVEESFLETKRFFNESLNEGMQRKNVKTIAELENVFNRKPNENNITTIKEMKEDYKQFLESNKEVEI